MKKALKRNLPFLLVFAMIAGLLPAWTFPAKAACETTISENTTYSGTYHISQDTTLYLAKGATFSADDFCFDGDYTLTLRGAGTLKAGNITTSNSAVKFTLAIESGCFTTGDINCGDGSKIFIDGGSFNYNNIYPYASISLSDGSPVHCTAVTVAGLSGITDVTYSVDGGSPIESSTDERGKLYLWLTEGSHTIAVSDGPNSYSAWISDETNTRYEATTRFVAEYENSINDKSVAITKPGSYVITGSGSTSNTIMVNGSVGSYGMPVNITLDSVDIDASGSGGCAFSIGKNSYVRLTLRGTNRLKSGEFHAGLNVPETATIVIEQDPNTAEKDSLVVTGEDGAGIGANRLNDAYGGNGGAVIINGGKITAMSSRGAGIGGAAGSPGSEGVCGAGGTLKIAGGTVTALSERGAGIGGGGGDFYEGAGGAVTISSGTVTASSVHGAGIGRGWGGNTSANAGTCVITGGSVKVSGGNSDDILYLEPAALYCDNLTNKTPAYLTTVTVGAVKSQDVTYTVDGGDEIETSTDADGRLFLWLAEGSHTISISDGTENYSASLTVSSAGTNETTANAVTASVYSIENDCVVISKAGNYIISGTGSPTANTITISDGIKGIVNVRLNNVNIDTSAIPDGCAFKTGHNTTVNLTLSGSNALKSGDYYAAGLQVPDGTILTIRGSGSLSAVGGSHSAGIGNGFKDSESCGTVNICGGTVTATGGNSGAAGIGGSYDGNGGIVNISGGTVTAIGGSSTTEDDSFGGAGIGSGYEGKGGTVNISGGMVTATGGYGSAGIGGGDGEWDDGSGGAVNISGGTVTATGGCNGAGIGSGSGYEGSGSTVYISGGSVHAAGGDNAEAIGKGCGGSDSGTLQNNNGDNTNVYLTIVTLADNSGSNIGAAPVSSLAVKLNGSPYSYGISNMETDKDGKLYLYLPGNSTINAAKTVKNGIYSGAVTTLASSSVSGTLTPFKVSGVTPNGTGITTSGKIAIAFSRTMNTSVGTVSLNGSTTPLTGGNWSADDKTYTTPYFGLSCDTAYTITISGFKDADGNEITADSTHTFTTNPAPPSNGGSSSANTPRYVSTSDGIMATTTVMAKTGADGNATATVTAAQISDALADVSKVAASHGADKQIIKISVDGASSATGVSVTVPQTAFSALANHGADALTISAAVGSVTFDSTALDVISKSASDSVTVTISRADTSSLTGEKQAAIGERPVYNLSITSGGAAISDFGGGTATVSVPYKPAVGEDPNKIVMYYISGNGELIMVPYCVYNSSTGMVTFKTTHFSVYAIGYHDVSFADVSGWYQDYVNFLASRNIIHGTSQTAFSPDAGITRAQFVTILANLSGDDLSGYTTPSFTDVNTTDWYCKAVEWAFKNKVATGSDDRFNPNANITREQMAVMLYNYAKYAGLDVSKVEGMAIREFKDYKNISGWAMTPIGWAMNAGILSGNSGGNFAPKTGATRAEAAKMTAVLVQGMVR